MTVTFDPGAGVLRLSHAALSVLARLASEPNHPDLVDHAVAPPLAALLSAGVIGPGGIHPDVRPLAEVVGAPRARLDLELAERGVVRQALGWADRALVVLAVPAEDAPGAFDLVADTTASAAELISELVGLTAVAEPRGAPIRTDAAMLDVLLGGGDAPDGGRTAPPDGEVPQDLARLAPRIHARWRCTARTGRRELGSVEVVDAGDHGLWSVESADDGIVLVPTSAVEVRRRLLAMVGDAPA